MAFLDMFDKLDDIIYKPVEAICDWTKEPLRRWEHNRDMETQAQNIAAAERDKAASRQHELDLAEQASRAAAEAKELGQKLTEQERASVTADIEARARIDADVRKWNAEIDQMILENEDARRDRLVECIKRYQIDLANAIKDIVNSIGAMSLELRERANALVLERTRDYRALQDESKKNAMLEIKEAKEMFFEDDPETYRMMVSQIMSERASAVELAEKFILELSEDFKRLNQNTDELMRIGMENTSKYLSPMANGLGVSMLPPNTEKKLIPEN